MYSYKCIESPLSHLPSLVVNERETLFASNSAAKFLFPVMQLDDQYAVDQVGCVEYCPDVFIVFFSYMV